MDAPRLDEVVGALGAPPAAITAFAGDMGCPERVDALFETAVRWMGGVDLFIASAGFAYYERLDQADWPLPSLAGAAPAVPGDWPAA